MTDCGSLLVEAYDKTNNNLNINNDDDEIYLLKELFFNSKIISKSDWRDVCIKHKFDYKFWADITHKFGINYEDECVNTKYLIKSDFGDQLYNTNNFISSLRNETAFHLLSGMIENKLPGSIRLIIRANGYQYFENRINQIINNNNLDTNALTHNINAIITIFPYLLEYNVCPH